MTRPDVRYAKSGDVNIAYQVYGEGPIDLVLIFGFISHLDLFWDGAPFVSYMDRLARFSRVIMFDKRGVGLSDPVARAATLEERMDDVRAVMEAAGSTKASVFGVSEGGPMAVLFASTYPQKVTSLVLYGAMAKTTASPDYPWASTAEAYREANEELIAPFWGQGASVDLFSPSLADDPEARQFYARLERQGASPQMVVQLGEMFMDIDVRHVLPAIRVPTLVLHRRSDLVVNVGAARYLANNIPGAKYVELEGADHNLLAGDSEAVISEVEEFLTGIRPAPSYDRVLSTVMFTDIVDSTRLASELGDSSWRNKLEAHQRLTREALATHRGREVKTTGDGFLATFDGPARSIRCAAQIVEQLRSLGIQIRVGIHTGECELIGEDVGGIAVHTAARISAMAGPSEILVSRTVNDLVAGSGISFLDRGAHQLKGIPDEWQVYQVADS